MKIKISGLALLLGGATALTGCSEKSMTLRVVNHSDFDRSEIVEIPLGDIRSRLGDKVSNFIVTDGRDTLPCQVTSDQTLIFPARVKADGAESYTISPSETALTFPKVCVGREYPERNDDISWENDLIAYRVYGPATQRNGERAFGYDIFFKYPGEPVLDHLYAHQTSGRNWAIADSLQKVDPEAAKIWRDSISYHVDHGKGMDCYAVGATLGAGVPAIVEGDSVCFSWCYDNVEILDNGPLRFKARLDFAPVAKGSNAQVAEHREVSLDAGSHLNHSRVWYEGLRDSVTIVAGMPRRDDTPPLLDADYGFVAYSDPTQGTANGRGLIGVVEGPGMVMTPVEKHGHTLLEGRMAPTDTLDYYMGFAWDKTNIRTMEEWEQYLTNFSKGLSNPLEIIYQ